MTLCSMSLPELEALMQEWKEPSFRAKQIFSWLHRGARPEEMTNLPQGLRVRLAGAFPYGGAVIYDKWISQKDGTVKYLFALEDGNLVEGVLMRYHYGNTLCISTQVGCRMGCAFCASTLNGCVRNLQPGEMLAFITCVERDLPAGPDRRTVSNLVLMGSGEPLDNYENVAKFLGLVTSPGGMNISPRNISLSTCGLVPMIYRLMEEAPHVTLCISLHAPNDAIRSEIMPINRKYAMEELLTAAKTYAEKTGRRVIFEYALIEGINDSKSHATALAGRLNGIKCHVNLIPLNPVKERALVGVNRARAEQFAKWLEAQHVSATIRREMGTDIEGACGQLRHRVLEGIEARERKGL